MEQSISIVSNPIPETVYVLTTAQLASDVYVIMLWNSRTGKYSKKALVECCEKCAAATVFRMIWSGKWKELAPEDEEDYIVNLPPINLYSIGPAHS